MWHVVTHLSLSLNNNSMMYVDHKHCASFGLACSLEFISQPSGEVVEFDFIYFFTWVYYLKRLQVIFHQETWDKNNILLDFDFIPQDLTGLWKKKQKKNMDAKTHNAHSASLQWVMEDLLMICHMEWCFWFKYVFYIAILINQAQCNQEQELTMKKKKKKIVTFWFQLLSGKISSSRRRRVWRRDLTGMTTT